MAPLASPSAKRGLPVIPSPIKPAHASPGSSHTKRSSPSAIVEAPMPKAETSEMFSFRPPVARFWASVGAPVYLLDATERDRPNASGQVTDREAEPVVGCRRCRAAEGR